MNAMEVMDPVMDAGMAYPQEMIPEKERIEPLPTDAGGASHFAELTWRDVCWVMDRLLACDLEWLRGTSLVQTVYTCTFFHKHVLAGTSAYVHWSHSVLSAYVLAVVKTCALQWYELARHHVLDQEDYCSETGGTPFPDAVEPRTIAAQLSEADECVRRVYSHVGEPTAAECISLRLLFRQHWLLCVESLTSDEPSGLDASMHLDECLRIWHAIAQSQCPILDTAMRTAPRHLHSYFDVTLSRALSSHFPLRPVALPDVAHVCAGWHNLMTKHMSIPLRLLASDDVLAWQSLLVCMSLSFQQDHGAPEPLIRSLIPTLLANGSTAMGGTRDLEHLAACLIEAWHPISVQDLQVRLEWHQAPSSSSSLSSVGASAGLGTVSSMLGSFLGRLASCVAQSLAIFVQNRSRQKRSFGKAYTVWMSLLDSATSLNPRVCAVLPAVPPDALVAPVQYMLLVHMEQVIGSGFDLELYDVRERACMYWVLAHLFEEASALGAVHNEWKGSASPGSTWQCYAHSARAQRDLCYAHAILYARTFGPDLSRAQAAFSRRLKWLRRPAWCSQARLHLVTSSEPFDLNLFWASYARWHSDTLSESQWIEPLLELLETSSHHAKQTLELRASDPSALLCRRERRTLDQHVLDTSTALETWVRTHRCAPTPDTWIPSMHPWYATLRSLSQQNEPLSRGPM